MLSPIPLNDGSLAQATGTDCGYQEHWDLNQMYMELQQLDLDIVAVKNAINAASAQGVNGVNVPTVTNTVQVSAATAALLVTAILAAAGASHVGFYTIFYNATDANFYAIVSLINV